MGNIFMPLTWQVWVLHAFLVTFCGAAIWLMEATSPAELGRYSAKWRQRRGSAFTRALLGRPSGEHDRPLVEGGDSNELRSVDGLLTSIYAAWHVFFWNGPFHEPRTAGGKLAQFALSFHVLIITSSYTASLAGYLATRYAEPVLVPSFSYFTPLSSQNK